MSSSHRVNQILPPSDCSSLKIGHVSLMPPEGWAMLPSAWGPLRTIQVLLRLELPEVRLCPLRLGLPDRLYAQPAPTFHRPGYSSPWLRMCLPQTRVPRGWDMSFPECVISPWGLLKIGHVPLIWGTSVTIRVLLKRGLLGETSPACISGEDHSLGLLNAMLDDPCSHPSHPVSRAVVAAAKTADDRMTSP